MDPSTREAKSLLRDVEFPEHVLIKRVVDINLDPIQAHHALLELFGELSIHNRAARGRIHFRHDRI